MSKKSFISQMPLLIKKVPALPFLIVLFIISVLNKFPEGYIYSYSDFFQVVNFEGTLKWFSNTFVDWGEGYVNFLYVPVYFVVLGFIQDFVGPQYMSVAYCFIFLAGSFISFYIATLFYGIDKKTNRNTILCFSLLYAVNSYTAIRFALPSIYFLPYIFIPVLFATVHAYFMKSEVLNRNLLWCAVVMLASTACWAGPPFFIAYSILTFVYIALVFIFYRKYSLFIFIRKAILYYFVFVSSFVMYLLTWPALLFGNTSDSQSGNSQSSMLEWLYSQSLTMLDVFSFRTRLIGLVNINEINFAFFLMFTFSLFLIFLCSFLVLKKNSNKKILIIFCVMILTTIFFLNKGKGLPWEAFTHSLFDSNLILRSLRSFDKTLIFLPFMLLMPYCLYSANANHRVLPWILLASTFILSYPLIYGDMYKKYYGVDQGADYLTSKYAPLVKIPQEYFDIISKTNRAKSDFKVLSVPWSLDNPDLLGWIISPKWKNIGANPVIQYFKQPFVQMNVPSVFRGWNYGAVWNGQGNKESLWLMSLSGILNTKYLIFQKDVQNKFVSQVVSKINFYKGKGLIKLLASYPNLDFFEIADTSFLPHFYVPDKIYIVKKPSSIPFALENALEHDNPAILESYNRYPTDMVLNHSGVAIEYKKINSTKYRVKFHGITKSFPLVFSETFYPFWRIYPKRYVETKSRDIEAYKIFEHNEAYQATKEELEIYLEKDWVSELGDRGTKTRKETLWASFDSPQTYEEKYVIDFISKKVKGTIQNDNISDGHFYDTWSLDTIDEKFHRIANGYANYWQIDIEYLKKTFPGTLRENPDGSYDLEVIVEFWPQKVLNISRVFTIAFTALICLLLIKTYVFKKGETPPVS